VLCPLDQAKQRVEGLWLQGNSGSRLFQKTVLRIELAIAKAIRCVRRALFLL
jgi:hypothetical protein